MSKSVHKQVHILGRTVHVHYLLLAGIMLYLFILEIFPAGALHHVADATLILFFAYVIRRMHRSNMYVGGYLGVAGTAWLLDCLDFYGALVDVEGIFWLGSHLLLGYALSRFLFTTRNVTDGEIAGAVSLFLLIGIGFANIYSLVLYNNPGALVSSVSPAVEYDQVLYYSLMTQATVGYGDVVPGHRLIRAFSMTQAMVGVMYIAVFISWFVSTHSAHCLTNSPPKE